jgi:hypothetical protein
VTDGVDADVDAMQLSNSRAMPDGARAKAEGDQLPACNHTVLTSRKVRNRKAT